MVKTITNDRFENGLCNLFTSIYGDLGDGSWHCFNHSINVAKIAPDVTGPPLVTQAAASEDQPSQLPVNIAGSQLPFWKVEKLTTKQYHK